jgi:predicted dienelactone hydrolase
MRVLVALLVLLAAVTVARADDVSKVGVTTRDFIPVEPYDWRGAKTHALNTTIWYPAAADARDEPQWAGPPVFPFFSAGNAARDAVPADGDRHPLILLSHGNGDMAVSLAWLATALAARGFLVAAVDHPGNNALADYTVEGFSLWWMRTVDLGAVVDAMLSDKTFASMIDPARIGAAGHSYGGTTVIALAGGIADPARLQAFCTSSAADVSCKPRPPFADTRQKSLARLDADPDYRQRYGKAGNSWRDSRVRSVFAMAPGLGPVFVPESLARISIPVAMAAGGADEIIPPAASAETLSRAIPQATLKLFPQAGHFVFVNTCTAVGRLLQPTVCVDPAGVDREAIHRETIKAAVDFFTATLR